MTLPFWVIDQGLERIGNLPEYFMAQLGWAVIYDPSLGLITDDPIIRVGDTIQEAGKTHITFDEQWVVCEEDGCVGLSFREFFNIGHASGYIYRNKIWRHNSYQAKKTRMKIPQNPALSEPLPLP